MLFASNDTLKWEFKSLSLCVCMSEITANKKSLKSNVKMLSRRNCVTLLFDTRLRVSEKFTHKKSVLSVCDNFIHKSETCCCCYYNSLRVMCYDCHCSRMIIVNTWVKWTFFFSHLFYVMMVYHLNVLPLYGDFDKY